jgi:DNA-directed RNA polymerase subunit beta
MVPEMIKREYIGQGVEEAMEMPSLIDIQLSSFERFLQRERLKEGKPIQRQGLEDVFQAVFPIESPNGDMVLEYGGYTLDEEAVVFSEQECKNKGLTYAIPIKAKINLIFLNTGEIRQKEIYMGDIPLMTPRGTFIVNGAERVVVRGFSPPALFPTAVPGWSSRSTRRRSSYTPRSTGRRRSWLRFF